MHHHHGANMGVKTPRAVHLAIVDAPEDLEPAVDALDCGAAGIEAFELFGGAWHAGKAPQVDLLFDAHGQSVVAFAVTNGIAGTIPTLMPRGAAILDGATLGFVADVRQGMPHWRSADLVIAEQRAGLIVDDIQRRAAAQHFLRLVELEGAVLNDRFN